MPEASNRLAEIRARLDAATPGPSPEFVPVYCACGCGEPVGERLDTREAERNDLIAHAPADIEYLLGVVADMHKFEERLIETMDQLRYETVILADKVESARGWAKLWKREAKIKRESTKNLARMWRQLWHQNGELRKYVVHKHNNCWQTGKCECGLDDLG